MDYNYAFTHYAFQDISASGQVLLENCDDCSKALDIGFPFTYYGRTYTQVYVSSNGFVVPGGANAFLSGRVGCCNGADIPYFDTIEGVFSLWWTDLSMAPQELSIAAEEYGKIYYQLLGSPGSRVLIIQFHQMSHFHNLSAPGVSTFQLKLFEADNSVEFHYQQLTANPAIHTIGIENPRQDGGIKYFRSAGGVLPFPSRDFALRFVPPEHRKLTSSLRYAAAGNIVEHVFQVNQSVNNISEINFSPFLDPASIVEFIDFQNPSLVQTNPAKFSLRYDLFDSLAGEAGGAISGDIIDFQINGEPWLSMESQTVFVQQAKIIEDDESKVRDVTLNRSATLAAFRSENNLLEQTGKSTSAGDIFFIGRDPDTLAEESHQLTQLSGSQQCGQPTIDDTGTDSYLYALCQTGSSQAALFRYNLSSYLNDAVAAEFVVISGTDHSFTGSIENNGWVAVQSGRIAYARGTGAGQQNIYLDGAQINSTTGLVSSLAMSQDGQKVIYVIDGSLYFYTSSTETLVDNGGVTEADISADGSTIVFNSTNDLSASNGDGSLEVFSHAAAAPFASFTQKTNLGSGACKSPKLNGNGKRVAVICNQDVTGLGNNFSNREAVFVIESVTGEDITHLVTGADAIVSSMNNLVMSQDGATLSFENSSENNAYRLIGLSNLDTSQETNPGKIYPIPFKLPGKGKSGGLDFFFVFCLLPLMVLRFRATVLLVLGRSLT